MPAEHQPITRRDLIAAAGVSAGLSALGRAADSTAESAPATEPATPVWQRPSGEPYELLGRRLVFTNWHYIRPGQFGWFNAAGENVAVRGSEDPWGATLRRFDEPRGIRLVAQPAQRSGQILRPERDWEDKGVSISSLFLDDGLYRGWGVCDSTKGRGGFCCFESSDGVNWNRPELGQVEFLGNKQTNLLAIGYGTVFKDPSAPPAERYKWVTQGEISREEYEAFIRRRPLDWEARIHRTDAGFIAAVLGATSPDGYRWTRLPEPLSVEHSDTQVVGCYDQALGKYVLYTRAWSVGPQSPRGAAFGGTTWINSGRRAIGRTESDDFRRFPLSEIILEPGPDLLPSDQLYTNCKTTLPDAPDHHVMFPAVWHTADDTTSIALASSHDGKVWHFLPGGPVLKTAPYGEWDGGCVFAGPNLVTLRDGSWALPYTGYLVPHKYPRGQWRFGTGYALWPHGRLVALEAPERGQFTTVGFYPPTRRMKINARTSPGGSIRIEVATLDGKTVPRRSFDEFTPIRGDQPAAMAIWKSGEDLASPKDAPIMLRFQMEMAELFGVEFV